VEVTQKMNSEINHIYKRATVCKKETVFDSIKAEMGANDII
jgi:hypothetical protein